MQLWVIASAANALPQRTLGFGGTAWTVEGTGKRTYSLTSYGFFEEPNNPNNTRFYTTTYNGLLGLDGWSTPAPAVQNTIATTSNDNNNIVPGSGVTLARDTNALPKDYQGRPCLESGLRSLGLNKLFELIATSDITSALSTGSGLTLFAPTDAAIQAVAGSLPSDQTMVNDILKNHVVGSTVKAKDLKDGGIVPTLGENSIAVQLNPPRVSGVRVSRTDQSVCSLTVHVIEGVIGAQASAGSRSSSGSSPSYGSYHH